MATKTTSAGSSKAAAPIVETQGPLFKKLFWGLMVFLLFLIPFLSKDAGINADERFQVYIAKYIIPFYTSFGQDRRFMLKKDDVMPVYKEAGEAAMKKLAENPSLVNTRFSPDEIYDNAGKDALRAKFNIDMVPPENNLMYYGGGFELISAVVARIFGFNSDDQMGFHTIRHAMVALITVLIILFGGLIAKEILGWRAAFLTVLLLAISPRFIGDGMMNNKDIPFALGYTIASYFMIRFIKQLPSPNVKNTVGVMLGIAAAINIRIGGIMLIFFFGFLCIAFWVYKQRIEKSADFNTFNLRTSVLRAFVACLFGYFLGLVFWPYGILSPINNPITALQDQTHIPVGISQLFEGQRLSSTTLPWYYLIKFMLITIPLVVWLGVAVSIYMLYRYRQSINMTAVVTAVFLMLVPLFIISYQHANVYNGWRQVTFIYPALVVLAALGFDLLFTTLTTKALKIGAAVVLAGLSLLPVTAIASLHPLEYVYFNEFVGGINGAFGNYGTDYWMMSTRKASNWLVENEISKAQSKVKLTTDCVYPVSVYIRSKTDKVTFQPYTNYYNRNSQDWDYAIFYCENVSPYQLLNGSWPPEGTIYTVKAGDAPLCAVVKKIDALAYEGHKALSSNDIPMAIATLEKAVITHPKNESVWSDLGLAYLSAKDMDKGIAAFKQALKLYPDNPGTYYYMGVAYAQASPPDYGAAKRNMRKALEVNPAYTPAQQALEQLQGAQ